MPNDDLFDPAGFSEKPLTGTEAARHRAMIHRVEDEWSAMSKAGEIYNFVQAAVRFLKLSGAVAAACGIIGASLKALGWL